MDELKKLTLEFNGIKDTIFDYTSSGNIANFINGLEVSLNEKDASAIKYYLNQIVLWYKSNINKIHSNQYVFNYDEHIRNKEMLESFESELADYEFDVNIQDSVEEPIIFVSHKSDDKSYGDALEKFIVGLGVKNNQIIYTSHPLHKIPLDENIYGYLRKNINNQIFMIILWSDSYLESPACLNEMGAAWVVQCDYTNIYVPDFSFGNPKYHECAVDTKKIGAVLNGDDHCKANMIELKNKILEFFKLEIDEPTSTFLLDRFMTELEAIKNH